MLGSPPIIDSSANAIFAIEASGVSGNVARPSQKRPDINLELRPDVVWKKLSSINLIRSSRLEGAISFNKSC